MAHAITLFPLCVPPRHPLRQELNQALALLEALPLNVEEGLPLIGVRTEPSESTGLSGLFDPDHSEYGVRITDRAWEPGLTLIHEVAHALDFCHFGLNRTYASLQEAPDLPFSEEWAAWNDAVSATDTTATIRESLFSFEMGKVQTAIYLLDPHELFARAFTQWVIHESGDAARYSELTDKRNGVIPLFWTHQEFATLMPYLEALVCPERRAP